MSTVSPDQLLHAVQTIEAQLAVLKQALGDMGIREEGVIGTFDGEFMTLDNGHRFQIPPNYASKSMLVPGDTLRMVEDPTGASPRFKQIAKAERVKSTGLLTKKDGKFEVLSEEGSFKVLTAAVKHFEGEVGDTAVIQFAKNHPKNSWAAVEKVIKAGQPANQSKTEVASDSASDRSIPAVSPAKIEHSTPVEAKTISSTPEAVVEAKAEMVEEVVATPPVNEIPIEVAVEVAAEPAVDSKPASQPVPEVKPSEAVVTTKAPTPASSTQPAMTKTNSSRATTNQSDRHDNSRSNGRASQSSRPVTSTSRPSAVTSPTNRPTAPAAVPAPPPVKMPAEMPAQASQVPAPPVIDEDDLQ